MSAVISDCGKYRYRLDRECQHVNDRAAIECKGKVVAFFGVNPSTADAMTDDATIRKMRGFSERWGAHRFIVGNLFAYRATDVRELSRQDDPFGPAWREHLMSIIADASMLVPCWGNRSKMPSDLRGVPDQFLSTLLRSGKPVYHLGLTASGDPRHPLMLGYDTSLSLWSASKCN